MPVLLTTNKNDINFFFNVWNWWLFLQTENSNFQLFTDASSPYRAKTIVKKFSKYSISSTGCKKFAKTNQGETTKYLYRHHLNQNHFLWAQIVKNTNNIKIAAINVVSIKCRKHSYKTLNRSSRSEIFAIFTGKHLCWSLFLIKLQVWWPATLLKRYSKTSVFLGILQNYANPLAASVCEGTIRGYCIFVIPKIILIPRCRTISKARGRSGTFL